jgi:hypothetical protein
MTFPYMHTMCFNHTPPPLIRNSHLLYFKPHPWLEEINLCLANPTPAQSWSWSIMICMCEVMHTKGWSMGICDRQMN